MDNQNHANVLVRSSQPLRIITATICMQTPIVPIPWHDHPFYQLEVIAAGRTQMEYDGCRTMVARGMASFFRPFQRHGETGRHSSRYISNLHIKFEADFVWTPFLRLAPVQRFYHGRQLGTVIETWRRNTPLDKLRAQAMLSLLILEIASDKRYRQTTAGPDIGFQWLSAGLQHIQDHLESGVTVVAVAQHVNMSPDHFSRLFHKKMGVPPVLYIRQARIERAKSLLGKGAACKEVAFALAFPSVAYFSRVFKQICGIAPSLWMETILSAR
ncbi:MAG: AraC family transcriptional regulator [Verrucomicrobia bacterium]|nr:AraC family transcriptional regulator [Verrucomicrobiota bacterium]MBU1736348.1 AraC family transcriptional regulator [Verrucomicrobiota bacterium]